MTSPKGQAKRKGVLPNQKVNSTKELAFMSKTLVQPRMQDPSHENVSPSKSLGCHQKSKANFIK
jgi:hypothetical protein